MKENSKYNKKIEVRCTQNFKERAQARAEELDIKLSDYIRMLIEQDLKEVEG